MKWIQIIIEIVKSILSLFHKDIPVKETPVILNTNKIIANNKKSKMKLKQPKIIVKISPNKSIRPGGVDSIDTIVIHHTAGASAESSVNWLCTRDYKDSKGKACKNFASAHYLIAKNGDLYKLVPDSMKAAHAGFSKFGDKYNVNDFSIGIEMDNKDGNVCEYTEEQYLTLAWLIKKLIKDHPKITKQRITSHQHIREEYKKFKDISNVPHKTDPGKLFDWDKLFNYIDIGVSE